ncbi:MAG: Hsp20/alpha crystallin family protein [bacterium]|nr:Hsp20/alpha crystallin family protein [Candidatus Kapabacteria bacterium]
MRREAFEVIRELESFASRIKDEFNQGRKSAASPARESNRSAEWPKVDVSYDDAAVYIEADLPGMRKDAVTVSMRGDEAVEISGRRESANEAGRERPLSQRFTGEFKKLVTLPPYVEVAIDQVAATMEEGVLRIRLPRRDAANKRTIEII